MTNTAITRNGSGVLQWAGRVLSPHIAQSPADGARSTIQAITTTLPNGTYIAPRGLMHQWGTPKPIKLKDKARDVDSARLLWDISVERTGCDWQDARPCPSSACCRHPKHANSFYWPPTLRTRCSI